MAALIKSQKRFQLLPKGMTAPNSLAMELPDFTDADIELLLGKGTAMKLQNKLKYSNTILIADVEGDNFYTLYKSYGRWRIGASSTRISTLDKSVNPVLRGKASKDVKGFETWMRELLKKDLKEYMINELNKAETVA